MSYYPPYRSSSNNIKIELDIDLSNYATKDDVKKVEDKVLFLLEDFFYMNIIVI